jgi:hypothetical protein
MPRLRHDATPERRRMVGELIGRGMPRETIASIVGIGIKALQRHYRTELERGADVANEQVAGKLFAQCMGDKNDMPTTAARIFWLKARGKWRDQYVEHAGPDGKDGAFTTNISGPVQLYLPDNGRDPPPPLAPPMKTIEHVRARD